MDRDCRRRCPVASCTRPGRRCRPDVGPWGSGNGSATAQQRLSNGSATAQQRLSNGSATAQQQLLLPRGCSRVAYRAPQRRLFRAVAARFTATRVAVGRPDRQRNRNTGYTQADGRLRCSSVCSKARGSSFGDRRHGHRELTASRPAWAVASGTREALNSRAKRRHRARSTAPSLVFCRPTLFPNCSLTPLDGPGNPRMSASSFRAFSQVRRCFGGRRWCAVDALSPLNRQVRGSSPWRRTIENRP
jgi:hypothetical protein